MTSSNINTKHAFTTRIGGVSNGCYASLNLSLNSDDDLNNIKENYARLCVAIDSNINSFVCSKQHHGTDIRIVTINDCSGLFKANSPVADGMITNESGISLIVFTADCVPILLHDPVLNVIGAVHAGWRGTTANIAGIAIQKMIDTYGCEAKNIKAAIGPCISKCCFETGDDVPSALHNILGDAAVHCIKFIDTNAGTKYRVDLKEANRLLLSNAGVTVIDISGECTACLPDKYWSHRRMGLARGSQASVRHELQACYIGM